MNYISVSMFNQLLYSSFNHNIEIPEAIGFDVDEGEAEEDTPLDDEGVFSALLIVVIVIGDTTSILGSFVPPVT